MRYLVTGGAGFIGSAVARRLIADGHDVFIVDNLLTGFETNIPPGAHFSKLDLSRPDEFSRLPSERFDAVLHFAAQSSGEISHDRPDYDLSANALGTLMLLRWCRERAIGRFVYASSMSVYGDVPDAPIDEEYRCRPLSFYGITKYAAEGYVRFYAGTGLNTTILRLFNVYGPGQNLENMKQGMVSIYLAYLLRGEPIVVKGNRDRFRDFVYIDDVVDAWMITLQNRESWGKTYNVGSGRRTTVNDLLDVLLREFAVSPGQTRIEDAGSTPADQFGIYADVSRIQGDLGWRARTDLSDGVGRMIRWARAQTV